MKLLTGRRRACESVRLRWLFQKAVAEALFVCEPTGGAAIGGGGTTTGLLTTVGAVSVGVCSDTGSACAAAADCEPRAHCYVPPGGCVTNVHTACDTTLAVGLDGTVIQGLPELSETTQADGRRTCTWQLSPHLLGY